jgi:hypothetical protein
MNGENGEQNKADAKTDWYWQRKQYFLSRREWNIGYPISVGVLLLTAMTAAAVVFQAIYTRQALDQARVEFKAAQRPYVSLGGRDGKIGNLMTETVEGKPVIALYFYNGGQSTALNFRVHIGATIPGTVTPGLSRAKFPHIHRYGISSGGVIGEIISNGETNFGLAAQAEHVEYILDPALLWTPEQLHDANGEFAIGGDVEYCDEFGTYHCQGWGAEYKPLLSMFVPNGPIDLPCVRESGGDAAQMQSWRRVQDPSITIKEIEPCHQPDELEYLHERDNPTTAPTPK